ncbi:Armadillo-like helical [Lasiodiplodia theobromae]|uniref:Protein MON2 n=1 Tax=Lasiodiplodia theobromae TaxID=45133 RepID=A0A5N5CZD9_9PEZI|nr:Armadillo-like helical protein [Lasiodiplodia theobromae]KAB2570759.1 Protein MON2 [Lasiodiplodia theobromae]KAF4535154.1 Armadillo-like helical protein [Lasiodiplodia theobromae]KAF9640498.1 Armadillo-like helical [Lasiodiplodia theobromae]
MTAQILSGELANLVNESKRKNPDLRNAADKSLQELRSLPSTSEAQLAADLTRRTAFIDPFVKACQTQNAKFVSSAVVCLQRLIVMRAVPRSRLREVLDGFRDSSQLSLDIQLKILQALPSLIQNYADDVRGELLSSVLQVCSTLQTAKNPVASATAAATLQQLVISTFEKVVVEDEKQLQIPTVTEVPGDDGNISVRPSANDAYKVFRDICLLTEGGKPQSIRFSTISQASGLELIEAILGNHGSLFLSHAEQAFILRTHIMPLIIKSLSERLSFSITLRIMRVFNLILRQHLTIVPSECEMALGLLNHMLDPDAAAPWKRAMCMEVFRNVYSDPNLIIQIYAQYDAQEGKKSIIRDNLAVFVRLSTEKPTVIGLGQHSTAPVNAPPEEDVLPDAQVALEAGAVGIIGGAPSTSSVPGISTQWSTMRIPCMDHLDKQEPPALPETYIYSLVLSCINNFSESLAKFILPLTVHKEGRKKKAKGDAAANQEPPSTPIEEKPKSRMARSQSFRRRTVPVNPLDLKNNPAEEAIKMTAEAINDCWPAVLATCSTFLNAALDNEYYHDLVRSIQKFTQIAGLLRLSTPRDAFLTTLGKAAVPPTVFTATVSNPKASGAETPTMYNNKGGLLSVDSLVSQGSDKNRRTSIESGPPTLSTRNLLCLRALLNLAIALGPTLESAWSIVFETLQQADMIMAAANSTSSGRDRRGNRYDGGAIAQIMGPEVGAVQAAASRLFESTVDFPNESFVQVLTSLCTLLEGKPSRASASQGPPTPNPQERKLSNFGINIKTELHVQDYVFSLRKLGDLGTLNANRLISFDPDVSGWSLLIKALVSVASNPNITSSVRLLAADVLSGLVQDVAKETQAEDQPLKNEIHARVLSALQLVIDSLYEGANDPEDELDETDIEVHVVVLDALKSILEQCGDSLQVGWNLVFLLTRSVFIGFGTKIQHGSTAEATSVPRSSEMIATNLGRLAFSSVQLVCSDFLTSIPDDAIFLLLDLLYFFCDQGEDLNISLTTITYFWNVSDYLHGRTDAAAMEELATKSIDVANPEEQIQEGVKTQSIPAMWLHLLERIATIAHDRRAEVRNGTLHTLLRIFDNYGDQLSPASWNLCLRVIMFRLLAFDIKQHQAFRSTSADPEEAHAWVETSHIILNGLVKLFSAYPESILGAPRFSSLWASLLDYFRQYLACGSQAVNAVTYDAISGLLGKLESVKAIDEGAIQKASEIWLEASPGSHEEYPSKAGNHEAYLAYVRCFREFYRLIGEEMDSGVLSKVASNLQSCIVTEESTAYTSDRDILTPLQKEVLQGIKIIKTNFEGAPTIIVKLLADFAALPFGRPPPIGTRDGNTFVAISKASMDLMQQLVTDHINSTELYANGALLAALQSLVVPIRLKYEWKVQGKAPSIWQKATTTSLSILGPILANAQSLSINHGQMVPIWQEIAAIANGIARADPSAAPSPTVILEDESFDIKSLTSLRDIITPGLGASYIPDSTRRAYTSTLFHNSLIHPPSVEEIPPDFSSSPPLTSLYTIRHGRTRDPPPTPRARMSYFCLRELLSLVHRSPATCSEEERSERIALARAAAPFLILRAALPIKSYIADQPLRGRMPQPQSQREELLFALRELQQLECEPDAIPANDGVEGAEERRHLQRLYPLVVKAVGVAGRVAAGCDDGGEVVEALEGVLDGVGVGLFGAC